MDKLLRTAELFNPLLQALRDLGGSGTGDEIAERVPSILSIPDDLASALHDPDASNQTELEYRLAWARTYLKNYGVIEKSGGGVWAIRADKQSVATVDPAVVSRYKTAAGPAKRKGSEGATAEGVDDAESPDAAWRKALHRILTTVLDPSAFERLTMRLLRESGFVHAEVTGRTGDGGIDGKGIAQIAGVLSFHVVFQCKRYKGAVSAGHVRDFRGAMVSRCG